MDLGTKKNFKGPSKLVRQPLYNRPYGYFAACNISRSAVDPTTRSSYSRKPVPPGIKCPQITFSLMSGGYDLAVTLRCKNIKDASLFVAQRLAAIDGVIATSTHFFLQKYKENGIMLVDAVPDERGME